MKSSNINVRISDELKDQVEYAKYLMEGGITKVVEDAFRALKVDYKRLEQWRKLRAK